MNDTSSLHDEFVDVLGSEHVYFQPPSNVKIEYPCIIYKRKRVETLRADNMRYADSRSYAVTAIYIDPDDDLPDKILNHFQFCSHNTDTYVSDGLYHDVFTLFY